MSSSQLRHTSLQHLIRLTPVMALMLGACQSVPVSLPVSLMEGSVDNNPYTSFSSDSPHRAKLKLNADLACHTARRVLLGDGYNLEMVSSDYIRGRKASRSQDSRSSFIEVSVICEPDPVGSTMFTNAMVSTYDVKMSGGSTASVGLSVLGSVSVPYGRSAESMVKVADETISDPEYYRSFYNALDRVIADLHLPEATAAPAVASEPAPAVEEVPAAVSAPQPAAAETEPAPAAPAAAAEWVEPALASDLDSELQSPAATETDLTELPVSGH